MKANNKGQDIQAIATKWDSLYEKQEASVPATVLLENAFLLPETGNALDLACGLGANALFLAKQGLAIHAWDISSVALNKLKQKAKLDDLNIVIKQLNIESETLPKNTFDVIVISRFLDRSLSNAIMESLKANGLLFYQTYVREKLGTSGPKNTDFLLARNELLSLFESLNLVVYRENSLLGNLECGERNEVIFIGQKS